MRSNCRRTLNFICGAICNRAAWVDICDGRGVIPLLQCLVEVGLISRFYRRNWKIRVYLIQDLRQQQFFFQLAKGDRYRNWYNRDQLKWGKGLQWIVLSRGGVKIVTDGQELKAAFHVLACCGWVLRYTNKLEGVVKNIWCDWLPWGSFVRLWWCILGSLYWVHLFWVWIVII